MEAISNIRIGTRQSELALWQANNVKSLLEAQGYSCTLVPVHSEGDIDLVTPLYAMGVQGVFTKTLDAYLLSNKIDIAVHSMKDVPTQLAQGIAEGAILPRGSAKDILVIKEERLPKVKSVLEGQSTEILTIGTGSVRRSANWLYKYPNHTIENLRGNVQTRLKKLDENKHWDAAIFAEAGLDRINILPENHVSLDWMLPAPAQGAIMIVARANDHPIINLLATLNDYNTALCAKVERDFLSTLMGGCSTPIGAFAQIKQDEIHFAGNIVAPDGSQLIDIQENALTDGSEEMGKWCAEKLLANGADKIVAQIKSKNG